MKIKTLISAAALSFCSLSAMATVPSVQPVVNQAQPNSPAHAQTANKAGMRHDGASRGQKGIERRDSTAQKHGHKRHDACGQKRSDGKAQRSNAQSPRHAQAKQARFANTDSNRQGRSHFVWVED